MGHLQLVKVSLLHFKLKSCIDIGPTAAPPTTCSDLAKPNNGVIGYNMGTASLRPVNTVANYTCDTGYTINGDTTRTCGSDGMWSGSELVCQRKWNGFCTVLCVYIDSHIEILICSDLTLTNGDVTYGDEGSPDNRPVNTVAFYSCNPDYTFSRTGESFFRVCMSGGSWDGSAPTCQGDFYNYSRRFKIMSYSN